MKSRYLVIGAEQLAVGYTTEQRKAVVIELTLPQELLGLAPDLGLMIDFSAAEARQFAAALVRKADELEAEGSQRH